MHLNRSSTRLHHPPGGATTFAFGDGALPSPTKSPKEVPAAHQPDVVEAVEVEDVTVSLSSIKITTGPRIGLAVAGDGSDSIILAVSKAFKAAGITGTIVNKTTDPSILPYIVQELIKTCDVVIASALLTSSATYVTSSNANALVGSLYEVGVRSGKAVIPAVISAQTLLEAKAVLHHHATTWVASASAILKMRDTEHIETEALPEPPVTLASQFTPDVLAVDILLDKFRESLQQHGARGIFGIGRKFRIADDDGNRQLDLAEFTKTANEHAMMWSPAQVRAVFASFDRDGSGAISFDEFLIGVRGDMNQRREQLVLMAFEVFDSDKSGVVDMKDIEAKYDASKHPDVISGKKTSTEVLREFLDTFDSSDVKDGKVTPREFLNYYSNVSASIDEDDYFELMIRNAWHISGGVGWSANSSCRRVLVTHADGRQTVEEIKNDMGIKADDKAAMLANLAAQGINDVTSVDTTGNASSSTTGPSASKPAPASTVAAVEEHHTNERAPAGGKPNLSKFSSEETPIRPAAAVAPNNITNTAVQVQTQGFNPRRAKGGQSSIVFG